MVKRFKAMLLLVLMLTSARFAKAETPKGEAHVSNKTNIETQSPVEDTSLENDIVKTNEATKEEVIVVQEEQKTKINEFLEQIQDENIKRMYTLLYKIAYEPVETHQMTEQELKKETNALFGRCSKFVVLDGDLEKKLSFLNNLSFFNELPDTEKQKMVEEYQNSEEDENVYVGARNLMSSLVFGNYCSVAYDMGGLTDVNVFGHNTELTELINLMTDVAIKAAYEIKDGDIDGPNYHIAIDVIGQAHEALQGRSELALIVLIPEELLRTSLGIYLSEDEVGKTYIDRHLEVVVEPATDNPTVLDKRLIDLKRFNESYNVELPNTVEEVMGINESELEMGSK